MLCFADTFLRNALQKLNSTNYAPQVCRNNTITHKTIILAFVIPVISIRYGKFKQTLQPKFTMTTQVSDGILPPGQLPGICVGVGVVIVTAVVLWGFAQTHSTLPPHTWLYHFPMFPVY